MSRKKDKTIPKSQQEIAFERIQSRRLDEEIAERERREKLLARGQLGQQTLLAGSAATVNQATKPGRARQAAGAAGKPSTLLATASSPGQPTPARRRALIGA